MGYREGGWWEGVGPRQGLNITKDSPQKRRRSLDIWYGYYGKHLLVPLSVKTFRGATEASQPDLPSWTRPPPNPSPRPDSDPILTRFRPEPSGPEETSWCRGAKIASRQFLSLNCLAITLTARVILKEEKCPLLWARNNLGGISGDNSGEGNCESKIVSRQWGDNFCCETSRCLAGPSGKRRISGPNPGQNQVKIRSESRFGGGRVQRFRSGWEGSVAPPESLDLSGENKEHLKRNTPENADFQNRQLSGKKTT